MKFKKEYSEQTIFDLLSTKHQKGDEKVLADKFRVYHEKNPEVYSQLRTLALKMRGTGRHKYGIAGLFEVLRWHRALETSDEDFKLNNSYRAFYARLLMTQEPGLEGFFSVRKSVGDGAFED